MIRFGGCGQKFRFFAVCCRDDGIVVVVGNMHIFFGPCVFRKRCLLLSRDDFFFRFVSFRKLKRSFVSWCRSDCIMGVGCFTMALTGWIFEWEG